MEGNGQKIGTLLKKAYFYCLPTAGMRTRYINRHKKEFCKIGKYLSWQPRKYPADPELIRIGDNVKIAADVTFVNHDIVHSMLEWKYYKGEHHYNELWGGYQLETM